MERRKETVIKGSNREHQLHLDVSIIAAYSTTLTNAVLPSPVIGMVPQYDIRTCFVISILHYIILCTALEDQNLARALVLCD